MKIKKHSAADVIKNTNHRINDKEWVEYDDIKEFVEPTVNPNQKWYERSRTRQAIKDYNFFASIGLIMFWGTMSGIIGLP